jgi:hypothetical protein
MIPRRAQSHYHNKPKRAAACLVRRRIKSQFIITHEEEDGGQRFSSGGGVGRTRVGMSESRRWKVKCTAACRCGRNPLFIHRHSTMLIKLLWVRVCVLIAARASERATPSRSASEAALRRLYRPDLNTPSRSEPPMWSVTSVGAPRAAAAACTSTRRPHKLTAGRPANAPIFSDERKW